MSHSPLSPAPEAKPLYLRLLNRTLGSQGLICSFGYLLGSLFFMASLTPSLIPRSGLMQGVLAGFCFAAGYGIGVAMLFVWRWLQLPLLPERIFKSLHLITMVTAALLMIASLYMAPSWQNEVRSAMNMAPVETVRPLTISAIAIGVTALLLTLGYLFARAVRTISRRLSKYVPRRLALVIGILASVLLFGFIGNDLVASQAYRQLDRIYARVDATLTEDTPAPTDPLKTGSPQSLLDWNSLGAEGRKFINTGPSATQISAATQSPALEPLRVYVGMNSGETAEARAHLALAEAIRIGAFERKVLVLATPTGTGWMDPSAHTPLETLLNGDVATVGVQYSYLPSWLSLLSVPEYGSESARAVFTTFHDYWRNLPSDRRPKLYLFGLSLGAMNTDLSYDFYDLVDAPIDGVFMAGPPFASRSWRQITRDRDAGSPAWLPRFRDGEVVRFMNQGGAPQHQTPWADTRILYLQYASDGIVFFSPNLLWQRPQWLDNPHGPDVSPHLRWFPIVTFLQVGFDLITATSTPSGHGHVYAEKDYEAGWRAMFNMSDPAIAPQDQ